MCFSRDFGYAFLARSLATEKFTTSARDTVAYGSKETGGRRRQLASQNETKRETNDSRARAWVVSSAMCECVANKKNVPLVVVVAYLPYSS